jgi:hypothetical protein
MSELIRQASQTLSLLDDDQLPPGERVSLACKSLSGLTLSDCSAAAQARIETAGVELNRLTTSFQIESEDDYLTLDAADAEQLEGPLRTISEAAIESEVQRVLAKLESANHSLPCDEIHTIRQHPELFVPELMQLLKDAIANFRDGTSPNGNGHFFAAFLLTELGVEQALGLLLEGFRLPEDGASELFGDALHELLPRILALFARHRLEAIDELALDTEANEFVRWSALQAYPMMVFNSDLTREQAILALERLLEAYMEQQEDLLTAAAIVELGNLAANSASETIRRAFDQQLVDTTVVDQDFIERQLENPSETLQQTQQECTWTEELDTLEELSGWASFTEPSEHRHDQAHTPRPALQPPIPSHGHALPSSRQPAVTIRTADARVGRNEPCPCGSGKKYKRCCR